MIKTLQKKFIFTAMIAVTILLVVLLGGINLVNARITAKQTEEMLTSLIQQEHGFGQPLHEKTPRPGDFFSPPPTEDDRNAALFFSTIVNETDGVIVIDTNRITSVSEEDAIAMTETARALGNSQGTIDRFRYGSAIHPDGIKYIFIDTSSDRSDILRMALLSLIGGMLCWGAMLLLVTVLSRRAIRPIAENMERQKQFVTDAGHEIKTPLAIILANTEAMELHNGENKWSRNIRSQVMRLNGLMQNLLTLSKADENKSPTQIETFSLSALTEEVAEMFRPSMELKSLSPKKQIEADISFSANKEQMTQLISILTDNAVKYAIPNSTVTITLKQTEENIMLQTENQCEGLPQCPPEKLFHRFYRDDAARTHKNGGYGIGLSAAKAITERHRGTIGAAYAEDDIIRFFVKLPRF